MTMSISAFCADPEPGSQGGGMVISASVPSKHKITVHYNSDGGYIMFGGKICPDGTEITVSRFGDIDLDVICGKNHHISKIVVNGEDVTDKFANGSLTLTDVTTDVYVEFAFEDCASDPNDSCLKVDMGGCVYLGDEKVKDADMSFDFGSYTAKTDKDGRYFVDDLSEGRHSVTVTKDGQKLGTCEFVVEYSDEADKVDIQQLPDGTQLVVVPMGTDTVYLDFVIVDENGDGIPDIDPDLTDPTIPPEGGFESTDDPDGSGGTDKDETGMYITQGTPDDGKKPVDNKPTQNDNNNNDKKPTDNGGKKPAKVPTIKIPVMGALTAENIWLSAGIMLVSLFFILLLVFKRKKDKEEEQTQG